MDQILSYVTKDQSTRILAADASLSIARSVKQVGVVPPGMVVLGQAQLGSILLGSALTKTDDAKLGLQWSVKGPMGTVFAEFRYPGYFRGTVFHPQAIVHDMKKPLGQGVLQVIKTEKHAHTGVIASAGDICTDLLTYLHQSEQRSCALNLWVNVQEIHDEAPGTFKVVQALGFLLELLPDPKSEGKAQMWENHLKDLNTLSSWALSADPAFEILQFVAAENIDPKRVTRQPIEFKCTCSEERAQRALAFAREKDENFKAEDAATEEVRCEFCGKSYRLR